MSLNKAVTEVTEIKRAYGDDAVRDLRSLGIRIPPFRKYIVSNIQDLFYYRQYPVESFEF